MTDVIHSWEQGTAAQAVLETDNPEYSVFGAWPFEFHKNTPTSTLQLALSAAVRVRSLSQLNKYAFY
jgi:hypothetical protein